MFSRRIFLQGAAGALTLLSGATLAHAVHPGADEAVTIDSAETPLPAARRGHRHVHLSGTQLERYNALKSLFGSTSGLRVHAHVDDTAIVLIEAALNESGRAVAATVRHGASCRFVVTAA